MNNVQHVCSNRRHHQHSLILGAISWLDEAIVSRRVAQDSNKWCAAAVPEPEDVYRRGDMLSATTSDGRSLIAVGCAEGIWMGFRQNPESFRLVVGLKMVTQCAVLEEFGIFLVLADGSLFAYHIEALVPSSPNTSPPSQVPQKLNGSKDVHFFRVGILHNRTVVVYMKKNGVDSVFRVLEPVGEKINQNARALSSGLDLRSAKSEWFRNYRDFVLPLEAFDIIFLKTRVAILCSKGFEIMDIHNFDSITIPQRRDTQMAQLVRRCRSARPKGIFRSAEDEFLLCYAEFGVYVDSHGDPSRSGGTIEWEGTAERVALYSPYILLFDSRFIEIRHIETGRLAQIISGNDIRCTWDGQEIGSNIFATPVDGQNSDTIQDPQVHVVMTNTELTTMGNNMKAVAQNLFELIPTVRLYRPESLTILQVLPPQSQSPPDSPDLRVSASAP